MTTYAFVDTETTGLTLDAEIWEFAAILRREDGAEATVHIHIDHDFQAAAALPEQFRTDHDTRFGNNGIHPYTRTGAASIIHATLFGTHIVGVNPAFDAGHLERLLRAHGLAPSWNYHLIDLAAVTIGYLTGQGRPPEIPWRSDELAGQVMPMVSAETGDPLYGRHTALGDAQWCRDWWDALDVARGAR